MPHLQKTLTCMVVALSAGVLLSQAASSQDNAPPQPKNSAPAAPADNQSAPSDIPVVENGNSVAPVEYEAVGSAVELGCCPTPCCTPAPCYRSAPMNCCQSHCCCRPVRRFRLRGLFRRRCCQTITPPHCQCSPQMAEQGAVVGWSPTPGIVEPNVIVEVDQTAPTMVASAENVSAAPVVESVETAKKKAEAEKAAAEKKAQEAKAKQKAEAAKAKAEKAKKAKAQGEQRKANAKKKLEKVRSNLDRRLNQSKEKLSQKAENQIENLKAEGGDEKETQSKIEEIRAQMAKDSKEEEEAIRKSFEGRIKGLERILSK